VGRNKESIHFFNSNIISGVNELSNRVYATPVSSKGWKHLFPVLNAFLTSPGFKYVRTVLSDGEAAVSQKNVNILKEKINRPSLVVMRVPKKSYLAERFIRTLKTKIAEYCRRDKVHLFKGWRKALKEAVQYCNTKLLLPNKMRPIDVNLKNFLKVQDEINPLLASLNFVDKKKFKFSLGDRVYLKKRALTFPDDMGAKFSLSGYNSETKDTIVDREFKSSGRNAQFLSPYYKLENLKGWFREKDLSLTE